MFQKIANRYVITRQPFAPLRENLTWSTAITTSRRGDEERQSLRCNPIVTIECRYHILQKELGEVTAFINTELDPAMMDSKIDWWYPLWHIAYDLNEAETSALRMGTPIAIANPTEYQFAASGMVMVFPHTSMEYDVVKNYTLTNGMLIITDLTGLADDDVLSLAVLVEADLVGPRSLAGQMGDDDLTMNYRLKNGLSSDRQYNHTLLDRGTTLDTLLIPPQATNPDESDEEEQEVQFGTGNYEFLRRREQPVARRRYLWEGWGKSNDPEYDDLEDPINFRRFLFNREGRTHGFLVPSFNNDLLLTAAVTASALSYQMVPAIVQNYLSNVCPYVALSRNDSLSFDVVKVNSAMSQQADIILPTPFVPYSKGYEYGSIMLPMRLANDSINFTYNSNRHSVVELEFQTFYVVTLFGASRYLGLSACS